MNQAICKAGDSNTQWTLKDNWELRPPFQSPLTLTAARPGVQDSWTPGLYHGTE